MSGKWRLDDKVAAEGPTFSHSNWQELREAIRDDLRLFGVEIA